MADISKASRILERDLRFREQDPALQAERQRIIEALRHGNIHEVFAKETKFKITDFSDFFSNQWKNFKSQIIQDAEIKAAEASYPPPDLANFPVHHRNTAITSEEGELFSQSMSDFITSGTAAGAGKWKAQGVEGSGAEGAGAEGLGAGTEGAEALESGELGPGEIVSMADGTLAEWDQFQEDIWGTIFDAQLTRDMQSKMAEIRSEVQRILAMVKSGAIGPEFALIALAKVNSTRNGVLMSGLGKKMFHINENMNRMSEELYDLSASGDPNYYAQLQLTQSETRDGAQQLNLLTQDMQKVMQNIQSTIEFAHSGIDQINRTRREIIVNISK